MQFETLGGFLFWSRRYRIILEQVLLSLEFLCLNQLKLPLLFSVLRAI